MFKTYIVTDDINAEKARQVLGGYSEVRYYPSSKEDEIIKNCSDADAIISLYEPITAEVMDAIPNLKFISIESIGFNTVDINHAKTKGIRVSNNPNYCVEEVADHTAALILTLARKLLLYNKSVQERKVWEYDAAGQDIYRLSSRTIGLVGFGSISRKVAQRLKAFGCSIMAYDPFISQDIGDKYGVDMVQIDEILSKCDVISTHMPLNGNTANFFNWDVFVRMKKKPIFINCARGGVVDEQALLDALDAGLISAAGLDVLESETPDLENCGFLGRENVILTPHAAFYSQQSMEEAQTLTVMHVKYFITGQYDKIPLVVK